MRNLLLAGAAAVLIVPTMASAQSNIEGRVGKLESEMRAVQRKVFPGGANQYVQPEITAPQTQAQAPGVPATSALADLTARVTSLEEQLTSLTGQVEQSGYRTRQLQDQFDAYKRATDARLKALESGPAPIAPAGQSAPLDTPTEGAATAPRPGRTPAAAVASGDTATGTPAASGAATVDKPSTGDLAEDAYLYGYRLWTAKRYAEAETQLKKVVADYPKSRRASFAQNLLGRSYLDSGKPSLASMAFYENYKKFPDGERAPDSLLYLGQALTKLNKPADACKVYDELTDVYGGKISAAMKAQIEAGRTTAKCK
ncbi:tol-pal system protein YbgF [Sphingomonas paucimobilis]|uniref:Tetratricopeptide repeat protein n=2 Tax=Sphingomonas paucimobilis TaxID=13689 RepID=A0A411LIP6_SPHPI|nr:MULTISPECIES: tetratricopeptide repeat protein [Sphingomonas]MBQ1478833.1 tetratricopeptide repeat protein [Sphingomonas sp.]MCM3678325.1 tetratricopeptide repeat protein [Sphingomonas paucimobilis]MDG5969313.1 tetratricopeptide repeat protein [Sphingomonas paucimobilis]NNG57069.1 tetratricopeptide repeat protein [Sphingomonas paucimobilis]QBE92240.1 tetratricopeptide repeat protein [Sphingomonas paucimobilis]